MEELRLWKDDRNLQANLEIFINAYGLSGLQEAIWHYDRKQHEYICKNKKTVVKLLIEDIYYLEITKHEITIHTEKESYQKYGTLKNELVRLAPYGFLKCSQSCAVSLDKIKAVKHDQIILINNEKLHMSRNCAPKLLTAFVPKKLPDVPKPFL